MDINIFPPFTGNLAPSFVEPIYSQNPRSFRPSQYAGTPVAVTCSQDSPLVIEGGIINSYPSPTNTLWYAELYNANPTGGKDIYLAHDANGVTQFTDPLTGQPFKPVIKPGQNIVISQAAKDTAILYAFIDSYGDGGAASPGGPAGGDLAGTYPNPTVKGISNGTDDVATTGRILAKRFVSAAVNPTLASVSNSGASMEGAADYGRINFYSASQPANDRDAEIIFIGGQLIIRYANDAHNAFASALSISGGQGTGITGITSNSGSGSWVHTGALSATGDISTVASIVAKAGGPNAPDTAGSGAELFCNSAGNQSNLVLVDASRSENNRLAMFQWQAGQINVGFSNDAWTTGVNAISILGGSASGVSSINSNSGTGNWTHTGNYALNGLLTRYGNEPVIGNGIPSIYGRATSSGVTANLTSASFYSIPTGKGGMYRVSCYAVVTVAASTSSTLPAIGIGWTDDATNTPLSANDVTPTNSANAVGAFGQGSIIINAKEGTNITRQTSGYTSTSAGEMTYAIRIHAEYIG